MTKQDETMTSSELEALKAIDNATAELRQRNAARLVEAKLAMGTKYVLHPANSPTKHAYKTVLQHGKEA
jgi:hypothetical protein